MTLEACKKVAALKAKADKLKEELAEVNADLAVQLRLAGEELVELGIPRLPIDGVIIYHKQVASVRARIEAGGDPLPPRAQLNGAQRELLHGVLDEHGIGDLMPYQLNTRALQSWVIEQIAEANEASDAPVDIGDVVPEEILDLISVETTYIPQVMVDSSAKARKKANAQTLSEALGEDVA